MRRLALALAVALSVSACGGDSSTDPGSITGTYTLRTIAGSPLPYVLSEIGTTKYELLDDAVTLNANGTYTEISHTRATVNGQVSTTPSTDSGSYAVSGTDITFTSLDGSTVTGTVGAGTLTIPTGGGPAIYAR